jgi:FMN phosphatase YigB (HAD superfamily)
VSDWLKAIMFDLGQTLIQENTALDDPPKLMPGVRETIGRLALPMGIWANTRDSTRDDVREWLSKVRIDAHFRWIVTSFKIGWRKPAPEFFNQALAQCNVSASEVLFVGNQLNTDIIGAQSVGIATVYLADPIYRSTDDAITPQAQPTYTISTLFDLPALVAGILEM